MGGTRCSGCWIRSRGVIAAAGVRDRVVHHAVHDAIEPVLDRSFIFDSCACRRGKGAHRALDRGRHFLRFSAFV